MFYMVGLYNARCMKRTPHTNCIIDVYSPEMDNHGSQTQGQCFLYTYRAFFII